MLVNRREYVETNLEGLGEQEVKVLKEALTFWSRNEAAPEGDRITAQVMLAELWAAELAEPTDALADAAPADEMDVLPPRASSVHSFDPKFHFDGICRVTVYEPPYSVSGRECGRGKMNPCHPG